MRCPFVNKGCSFTGSEEEVEDHLDYMISVGDEEHIRKRGGKPPYPRCPKEPHLSFDQIEEEFHITCECGMDANLGQDPTIPDVVFAWQEHSKMKRRDDDSGGPN